MKRTVEIKVRLSPKEFEKLDNRVKRSRLSREAYLRQLIDGYVLFLQLFFLWWCILNLLRCNHGSNSLRL